MFVEKKDMFYYVSPIISYLIIFYCSANKRPACLEELIKKSGLKDMLSSVQVSRSGDLISNGYGKLSINFEEVN